MFSLLPRTIDAHPVERSPMAARAMNASSFICGPRQYLATVCRQQRQVAIWGKCTKVNRRSLVRADCRGAPYGHLLALSSLCVLMELRHPISSYTPLTEAELAKALEIGTLLNNKWLPISRRGVDRDERARAEHNFAVALARYLTLANFIMFKGPPMREGFRTPSSRED